METRVQETIHATVQRAGRPGKPITYTHVVYYDLFGPWGEVFTAAAVASNDGRSAGSGVSTAARQHEGA